VTTGEGSEARREIERPVPLTFKGYPCRIDCSGHEAGYRWAEEHGIDDRSDCSGNSESFVEGYRAYAEEQKGVGPGTVE
jgi:hypothetical protein